MSPSSLPGTFGETPGGDPRLVALRDALHTRPTTVDAVLELLSAHAEGLCELLGAHGVAVGLHGRWRTSGQCPSPEELDFAALRAAAAAPSWGTLFEPGRPLPSHAARAGARPLPGLYGAGRLAALWAEVADVPPFQIAWFRETPGEIVHAEAMWSVEAIQRAGVLRERLRTMVVQTAFHAAEPPPSRPALVDASTPHALSAEAQRLRAEVDESRFRSAFEVSSVGLALVALDGRLLHVNAALSRLTGYSESELLGATFQALAHPDDVAASQEHARELLSGRTACVQTEERFVRKDGVVVWGLLSASLCRGADGRPAYFVGQVQDVTARRRAEESLQRRESQLRALTNNLPDGFLFQLHETASGRRRLLHLSEGVEGLLGLSPTEGLADPHRLFGRIDGDDQSGFQQALAISRDDMKVLDHVCLCAARRGEKRFLHFRATPQRLPEGAVQWDGVAFDVTAQRQVEEELRRAKEEADAVNRAKSQFVASVSHELRTPLNGILGLAQLLTVDAVDPVQSERAGLIMESGQSLLSIVNDLLDYSKLESGRFSMQPEPVDLVELVSNTIKSLSVRAAELRLSLVSTCGAGLPKRVRIDPVRVRQILVNLIGNALKFTQHGGVTVAAWTFSRREPAAPYSAAEALRPLEPAGPVSSPVAGPPIPPPEKANPFREDVSLRPAASRENAAGGVRGQWIRLEVRDTGVGIRRDQLRKIFEAFEQGTQPASMQTGTGLGLTIAQRLADMMGGRIDVDSAVGMGSTFGVDLPLSVVDPAPWYEPHLASRGRTVLVLEPNPMQRNGLEANFAACGWKILSASHPAEAIARLAATRDVRQPLDLAFVSADYGPQSQIFAAEASAVERARVPCILLLGPQRKPPAVLPSSLAGALAWPYLPGEMQRAAAAWFSPRPTPPHATPAPAPRPAAQPAIAPLRVLLAEDNRVNQRVLTQMLRRSGHAVTLARTGREAVEACAAGVFDLVLMDMQMPEMGGAEATVEIRRMEEAGPRRTPIIAMTARAMAGDREQCLAAGMDGYLAKPVSLEELHGEIRRVAPSAAACEAPSSTAVAAPHNLQSVVDLVGQDPEAIREIADAFTADGKRLLSAVQTALAEQNPDGVARAAQDLVGLGLSFGNPVIVAQAQRLEELAKGGEFAAVRTIVEQVAAPVEALPRQLRALADTLDDPTSSTG